MPADGDVDVDEVEVAGEANAIELRIFDHSLNLIATFVQWLMTRYSSNRSV